MEDHDINFLVDNILYNEYWYLLQLGCVYLDLRTSSKKYLSIIYLILMAFLAAYTLLICVETTKRIPEDILISSQCVHFIILQIVAICLVITTNAYRQTFEAIHFLIGANISVYDEETKEGMQDVKNKLKNKKILLLYMISIYITFAGLITAILAPAIDNFLTGTVREEIYSPGGIPYNLPLPLWSPFGTHTTTGYLISLIMELLCTYSVGVVIICGDITLLVLTQFITTELELLILALKRLPQRTIHLYKTRHNIDTKLHINYSQLKENANLAKCNQYCIKETIIHHQKIIRTFDKANTLFSIPIFVAFFIASLTIAICGIVIIFGNGAIGSLITGFILGLGEILNILLISWCGEQMKQASEKLSTVLYSTKWYYNPKEESITLLIMMCRSQRPLALFAGGLIPVNFESFSNVMNTAYSYFNLLYASKLEA